jgi:ParB family chromosome partitioning protein
MEPPPAERATDAPHPAVSPLQPPAPQSEARARAASGAVKAMGLSLGGLSREIEDARRLKESLGAADRVVEIEPDLIDSSFVSDRLGHDDGDEGFQALMHSIEASGQQVPVLLRPHPEKAGRFQTAYGHRRVRAAARLGLRVQAIVRELSDTELVLAQGKENTERRDLSFIERAFFAHALVERGFERGVVQEALSLHKAEMTRYLQVAQAVPHRVANAIGPAPKIGRPRWMVLADLLKTEAGTVKADDEITSERFRAAAGSDARFNLVLSRLQRKAAAKTGEARKIRDRQGRAVAVVSVTKGKTRVEFVDKIAEGFEDFLGEELPRLLERFRQGTSDPAE